MNTVQLALAILEKRIHLAQFYIERFEIDEMDAEEALEIVANFLECDDSEIMEHLDLGDGSEFEDGIIKACCQNEGSL